MKNASVQSQISKDDFIKCLLSNLAFDEFSYYKEKKEKKIMKDVS